MTFASLILPPPISTNDIWRPTLRRRADGRRYPGMAKAVAYKAWLIEAGYQINRQTPPKITGRYALTIQVSRACQIDLGNAEKACSDLLQQHEIIENDRLAEKITSSWIEADKLPPGAGMIVMVVPCGEVIAR